jgi:hypothetical protein
VRSVIDFYRRRPLVLAVAVVIGAAVAIATTTLGSGDGLLLPLAFVAIAGILVGAVIGATGRRRG